MLLQIKLVSLSLVIVVLKFEDFGTLLTNISSFTNDVETLYIEHQLYERKRSFLLN